MTLLLGPPGSGKTTLLLALSGKLDSNLKVVQILYIYTHINIYITLHFVISNVFYFVKYYSYSVVL